MKLRNISLALAAILLAACASAEGSSALEGQGAQKATTECSAEKMAECAAKSADCDEAKAGECADAKPCCDGDKADA